MPLPRCPFYGFDWPDHGSTLRDAEDGRCGLLSDGPELCRMEASGRAADVEKCDRAHRVAAMLNVLGEHLAFLPSNRSKAITYSQWSAYRTRLPLKVQERARPDVQVRRRDLPLMSVMGFLRGCDRLRLFKASHRPPAFRWRAGIELP